MKPNYIGKTKVATVFNTSIQIINLLESETVFELQAWLPRGLNKS